MANMSSFYGGRSAPSFTIVKNFDGIDVPSNKYTKTFYAVNDKNELVHGALSFWEGRNTDPESIVRVGTGDNPECIIRKTRNNFVQYSWRLTENNGTKVDEIQLPQIFAKGMFQCFSEGVATLDEVNYQEYVLIDTVTNLNEYSNPDNGKIYRRGFDVNNGMHGAEYIGRIIGPQGFNTGIQLDTFSNIKNDTSNQKVKGTVIADLLPGSNLVIENNQLKEGQGIECIYANVLDEGGNILQTKIGFKFPYLVNTFKGKLVTPYDITENENLITEIKENGETLQNSTDNPNPFYRYWSIKIPNGKKGDSIELIRKQPTLAPAGIKYYTSLYNLRHNISEEANTLVSNTTISSDKYLIDREGAYIQLDTNKFVKVEDCTNNKIFYIVRNYNNSATGDLSDPIEVGNVDSIIKTSLDKHGTLTIHYDNGETEDVENKIRWINNLQVNTTGENPNYKLHVTYNTPKSNGIEEEDIGESINYIKEMYISNEKDKGSTDSVNISSKHLFVKYSDPKKQNAGVTIAGKDGGWTDLGSVEPPAANVQILTGVPNKKDHLIDGIPPEVKYHDMKYKGAVIPANDTNILYYYDYINEKWVSIGTVGQGNITSQINYVGKEEPNVENMYVGSLWFQVTEKEEL